MNKNNIKSKLHSFLAEADKAPVGKTETDKVQKQEKSVNNDYYKEVSKKMGEYDSASTNDKDSVKKGDLKKTSSEDTKDVNFNGMDQIQYDNEPSEQFKQRAKEALEGSSKMGNKTYTGEENGNTEEVWGASGGKHTGEEIVKAAVANSKKDARPQEDAVGYVPTPDKKELATETKEKTNEIIKENKMEKVKRLRFEKPFNGLGKALTLIPESYKVDDKVFEMTDGNENYRIRWEGSLDEGQAIVLRASDKQLMNEDIQHMKHLMGFKAENTLGTPSATERVNENSTFRDIMNMTKTILTEGVEEGDRKPINESAFAGMGFSNESNLEEEATVTEEEVSESKGETPNEGGEKSKIGDTADGIVRGAGHDKHVMEDAGEVTEGEEVNETEEVSEMYEGKMPTIEEIKSCVSEGMTYEQVCEKYSGCDKTKLKEMYESCNESKEIAENDSVLEGFENPTVFTISEGEATENMPAGDDLGTKIGKTAAGHPRGAGHDEHVMEDAGEVTEGEEITEEDENLKKEGY
jgi:hypothetical protein